MSRRGFVEKRCPSEGRQFARASFRFSLPRVRSLRPKGDPHIFTNYRSIGLCNTLAKLHTTVMLSDSQAGFREKRKCADQLLYYSALLEDSRMNKSNLYALYVDFARAFPSRFGQMSKSLACAW